MAAQQPAVQPPGRCGGGAGAGGGAPGVRAAGAGPCQTLLFVDVDGVLNVGARDGPNAPLLLDEASVQSALRLWDVRARHPERDSIERLVSIWRRALSGPGEEKGATFAKLACRTPRHFSDELVARFAKLIRASGWGPGGSGRAGIVLTSTWRLPQHKARLAMLEEAVSKQLGAPFAFDARTAAYEDHSPEGRVRAIGEFLAEHCQKCGAAARGPLRALVLDDFYNRPLDGWWCGGRRVTSTGAIEAYLRQCVPPATDFQVKMLHTYGEWATPQGLSLQVGTGLSMEHVHSGALFLEGAGEPNSRPALTLEDSAAGPPGTDVLALLKSIGGGEGGTHCSGGGAARKGSCAGEDPPSVESNYFAAAWPWLPALYVV